MQMHPLYADDTILVSVSEDLSQLVHQGRFLVELASKWFLYNGFRLNEAKTVDYVLSLRGFSLRQGPNVRLLGFHCTQD